MVLSETYDDLRILLSPSGFSKLPDNELTDKLLRNIFTDDEANLVVKCFKETAKVVSFDSIADQIEMPKDELRSFLRNMKYKGSLMGVGPAYMLLPYLPGLFEFYFTNNTDAPERMKKAGEAHYELIKQGFQVREGVPNEFNNKAGWRIFPTVEPILKSLDIEQEIEVQHQILPWEMLEEYLLKQDTFAVQRCSCRNAASLSGNPCKQTDENYCVSAGLLAKNLIKSGIGKEVSYKELVQIMKEAEEAGLVHSTTNMTDTSMFICNCCSCCCGFINSVRYHKNKNMIARSNFEPKIDHEACILCETCIEICPMGAISHVNENDNEKIDIKLEDCLGCGLCATHCPENTISLIKTSNYIPPKNRPGLFG